MTKEELYCYICDEWIDLENETQCVFCNKTVCADHSGSENIDVAICPNCEKELIIVITEKENGA